MKRGIIVRGTFAGVHAWKECNIPEVSFLKEPHRHLFNYEVHINVSDRDRELEFFVVKGFIDQVIENMATKTWCGVLDFEASSCEELAESILIALQNEYGYTRSYVVKIFEDNENGGMVSEQCLEEYAPQKTRDKLPNDKFVYMSWAQVITTINDSIEAIKTKVPNLKRIIAIKRGGIIPATLIHRYFPEAAFELVDPSGSTHCNKDALVVDDIWDTGSTIKKIATNSFGGSTFYTLVTKELVGKTPYFHMAGYYLPTSQYIVFPWELEDLHDRLPIG